MIENDLKSKYGEYLSGLDIYETNTSLKLARIVLNKLNRNEGIGTKIMEDLVNYADKNKQIIALTPSSDFGGNVNRLIQFYKRFGFKHNKGQYKHFGFTDSMIRYPKMNETSKHIIKTLLREGLEEARAVTGTPLKEENLGELLNHFYTTYGFQKVFVSFRASTHVGKINPKNQFNTPTGLYAYNLGDFLDKPTNSTEEFRKLFPFASDREHAQFLILKDDNNVLDSTTSKDQLDSYVKQINTIFKNNPSIVKLCENWFNDTYESYYSRSKNDTHKLWLFIYDIIPYLEGKVKKQNQFSIIARQVGIDGFSDDKCEGWIHPNEQCQSVFFRSNIFGETRELNLSKRLNAGRETSNQKTDEDYINIFNKYGYTMRTLRTLLNLSNDPTQILNVAFNNEELLNAFKNDVDSLERFLFQDIKSPNVRKRTIQWLLTNDKFTKNLTPEILMFFQDNYRYAMNTHDLIVNNPNLVDAIDSKVLDNILSKYLIKYKDLVSNPTFIENISYNKPMMINLLTKPTGELFLKSMSPELIAEINETLSDANLVDVLQLAKEPKLIYQIFNDRFQTMSQNEPKLAEYIQNILNKDDGQMNENYKKLLREGLLTHKDTDVRQVADFVNFTKKYLGIKDDIKVILSFARTPDLATTAYYNLDGLVKVYVKDRAIIDICRSIAHELVHHKQNLDGRLTNVAEDGSDGSNIENEANAVAGEIIRKYGKLNPNLYI